MTPEQENKWEEDLRELQRHTPKKGLFSKRINFLFSKLRDQFENHENKLKDRDQEIERLCGHISRENANLFIAQTELDCLQLKIKERDELIKKSIPYIEYAIKYSTPLSQNKAEELVKNIKTLLGE